MSDPFKLTGPTCLSFSGGRTSAYMLWRVLQSNTAEDIAKWLIVCFANTGKEDEATLRFVDRCSREWGLTIIWIEYRDGEVQFAVVDFETASRSGEPFEALMFMRRLLPNPMSRFCTMELKIRPMARYLRSKGYEGTMDDLENFSWIGIRADEPRRIAKVARERVPLAAAGITAQDVGAFWKAHSFDLELPNMAGKTMHGNCDLCFLKPAAQVQALIAEKPERAFWWARMERDIPALGRTTPTGSVFRLDRPTYQRMAEIAADQGDMFDHREEAIACFCGD
jgi:3'-phosphoadenosine 5'-phosphosulfate sulfotransferase (PAPS reductase)/FAD synthetase